jgi:deoxyribonuclease-4
MSIAGGVDKALQRAASIGCRAVQIFTRNQLRWSSPKLRPKEIEAFRRLKGAFPAVFAHASYLINLASPKIETFTKSVNALTEELDRCATLGITPLVLHPGYHMGAGESVGIEHLIEGIRTAYERSSAAGVQVALETTTGQGTSLGSRFEELGDMLSRYEIDEHNLGVCLDTCHVFAAGYDLRDRNGYEETWNRFDRCIGLEKLLAIHLNDSLAELGSKKDRHTHIGEGEIGSEGFRLLVCDRRFEKTPAVLETPKGKELKEDIENLARLRQLARQTKG